MLRIGINGFGRIGRALTRMNLKYQQYDLVAINDIDPDINNLAYLLKYDTTYGKLDYAKVEVGENSLIINEKITKVFSNKSILSIPWYDMGIDVVIDASGVFENVLDSNILIGNGVKKVIITHSPKKNIDFTYIEGVNEKDYNPTMHHIISTSICDANAVAPFYKMINDSFGIELGEITTLHPWLSYQNLLDGTVQSVASPGHLWSDYALGRSSIGSLIPKATTLGSAMECIIPGITQKIHSTSIRVPTSIVSAAEGVFLLKIKTSIEEVKRIILNYVEKYPDVIFPDDRSLVSIDYLGEEYGAIIDLRWLHLNNGKMLKFVLWYDNEWGYVSRIYKVLNKIGK
jgi:glyceraldehyde 3-phosphate dehydrogenase